MQGMHASAFAAQIATHPAASAGAGSGVADLSGDSVNLIAPDRREQPPQGPRRQIQVSTV